MSSARIKSVRKVIKPEAEEELGSKNETLNKENANSHPVDCKCFFCSMRNGNFLKNLNTKNTAPILIVLLFVAVFFIGILVDKVSYLSKNQGNSQNNQQAGAQIPNQQPNAPQPGQKVNVGVGKLPPNGNPNAKVKIIEFADLRCPYCDIFFKQTEPQIISDYVKTGKAVIYFRNFAFLGQPSVVAANSAECANEQGKFWEMYNYLYTNQPSESDTSMFTTDKLTQVAGTLGMNTNQFQSCLSANKYDKNVSQDLADGQKAGVNGTPTFFINGTMIVGAQPYAQFKTIIDQALNGK